MPYTAPRESPSSPKLSPTTSSHPSPKGTSHRSVPPLKPALKLNRSISSEGPFHETEHTSANVREPRRRSYTSPSLPRPEFEIGSPSLLTPTKTVRFPTDQGALEGVRTFRKHGKPIHISHPASGEDTATETEAETSSASGLRYSSASALGFFSSLADRARKYPSTHFPKPSLPNIQTSFSTMKALIPSVPISHHTPDVRVLEPMYEVDYTVSSPVPSVSFDPAANVHLETLRCSSTTDSQASLRGTILVRNLAYSKHVAVRFTLDDWVTVSNVSGRHSTTLPSFPLSFFPGRDNSITPGDAAGLLSLVNQNGEWDRFEFSINVNHASYSLARRTLWLAVRFSAEGGEWWDNNAGENYKVRFRLCGQPGLVDEPENITNEESSSSRGESGSPGSPSKDQTTKMLSPSADNLGHRHTRSYLHTSHSLTSSTLHHFALSLSAYSVPQTLPRLPTRHPRPGTIEKWEMNNPPPSLLVACRM